MIQSICDAIDKGRESERNRIYERLKLLRLSISLSKEEDQLINKIMIMVLNPKISVLDINNIW